ncbi:MAG: PD-(D/E)XK motif protein [Parvibaculum sp.]|nr:PD-(D/E)XK motif protein [Parvibaculum sp.]
MPEQSTWDDIGIPDASYNVKRVAGATVTPCYWGRDVSGACLFIIELEGDHAAEFRKNTVRINGIGVDLRTEIGQQRLVLTLEKQADRDLFEGLCRTLTGSLEHSANSTVSLAIALAHLKRWKTFMSGRSQHLSAEEVRGLFAELVFLLELLGRRRAPSAVDSWMGPEKSHQDFIFGNTAVEVKSLSGAERSTVRISSEDQLESLNDRLFLRIYRLSDLPDSQVARSLNQIVLEVQRALDDAQAVEAFDRKLVAYSYAPIPEYDQPSFVVSEIRTCRVNDGFPRLIRSQLPEGIGRVGYDVKLESLTPYNCNGDAVFGEADGTNG